MNPKTIKDILENKETRQKIIEIITLRQEERILHKRQEIIQSKICLLQVEIEAKYKLKFLELPLLIKVLQDKEYSKYAKEFLGSLSDNKG